MVRKKAASADRTVDVHPRRTIWSIKPRTAAHTVDEKTSAVSAAMPKSRPPLRLAPSNASAGTSARRRLKSASWQSSARFRANSASADRATSSFCHISTHVDEEKHKPVLSFSSQGRGDKRKRGLLAVMPVAKQHVSMEGTRRSVRLKKPKRRANILKKVAPAVSKAVPPLKVPPLIELRSAPLKLKRPAPLGECPAKRPRSSDATLKHGTPCELDSGLATRISERIHTFQKKATFAKAVLEQRKPLCLRARSPVDTKYGVPWAAHAHVPAGQVQASPAAMSHAAMSPAATSDWSSSWRKAARPSNTKSETVLARAPYQSDSLVTPVSTRWHGEPGTARPLRVARQGKSARVRRGLSTRTARLSMVPRRQPRKQH